MDKNKNMAIAKNGPAPPREPPPTETKHPLVGAGLHYKDEDGCVANQAQIVAVFPSNNPSVGDVALIQYYEWFGSPSTRGLVSLAEPTDRERWVLYRSVNEMIDHYERVDQHQNRHIRDSKRPLERVAAAMPH